MIALRGDGQRLPGPAPSLARGRLLRGWNVHHHSTVFAQPVDAGGLADLTTESFDSGFGLRFLERFDRLDCLSGEHCVAQEFRNTLGRGEAVPLADVLLEAILAVERSTASNMLRLDRPGFSCIERQEDDPGAWVLVWESHSASLSRAAARAAFIGLMELLPEDAFGGPGLSDPDFAAAMDRLRRRARRRRSSPAAAFLMHAARQRGISFEILAGNYLRLGDGVSQHVVSDAALTQGVPVDGLGQEPEARLLRRADQADLHSILVVENEVVSVVRLVRPRLEGDGQRNITELVDALNLDPVRNDTGLRRIRMDDRIRASLADAGWRPEDVPQPGETLMLCGASSLESGAVPEDVTARLHPGTRALVLEAVAARGLQAASVDFLSGDARRSARRGHGRIAAIKAQLDLMPHLLGAGDGVERVGRALLDLAFPAAESGRVPIGLIVGSRGTRALARQLERHLRTNGIAVGLTTPARSTILGRPVDPASSGHVVGPEFVLRDPRVEKLLATASPRRIVRDGLRLQHVTVTAVLDPEPGRDRTLYRRAVDIALSATTGPVAIRAENPELDRLLEGIDPARVLLVAPRREGAGAARHLAEGGAVVRFAADSGPARVELRRAGRTPDALPVELLSERRGTPGDRQRNRILFTAALAFGFALVRQAGGPGAYLAQSRDSDPVSGRHS
jgi:hypothetical protein